MRRHLYCEVLPKLIRDVILGASVCCVFNWSCCQTSGPSSSYSWRSSTMNACSPTSQSCRRTGVWHLISPKKHTQHILVAKWNCVWFACCALMCSQRAKRGRRTAAAACLLRQTAWARNTLRRWARCAELTSGKPQWDALLRVCDVAPLIHRRVEQLSVWSECFHSLLLPSSLPHRKLLAPVLL